MAISDYIKGGWRDKEQAERFLFGSGDNERHFSLYCDLAGYEPEWVRQRVKRIDRHKLGRASINIGKHCLGEWHKTEFKVDNTRYFKGDDMGCKKKSGGGKKK